jgi:hypothetical protein
MFSDGLVPSTLGRLKGIRPKLAESYNNDSQALVIPTNWTSQQNLSTKIRPGYLQNYGSEIRDFATPVCRLPILSKQLEVASGFYSRELMQLAQATSGVILQFGLAK